MAETRNISSDEREIGARIRSVRAAAGVTQRELARALSVSFTQITKYEHGGCRVSAAQLVAIARKLNVSVTDLTGEGGEVLSIRSTRIVKKLVNDFCTLDEDLQEVIIKVMGLLVSEAEHSSKVGPKSSSAAA